MDPTLSAFRGFDPSQELDEHQWAYATEVSSGVYGQKSNRQDVTDPMTCDICEKIRSTLCEPYDRGGYVLGSGIDVLCSQPRCTRHHNLVMSALRLDHSLSTDKIHAIASEIMCLDVHKCPLNMATLITPRMHPKATLTIVQTSALHLMERPETAKERSIGKLPHARWIDRALAGSWKSACDTHHDGFCQGFPNRALSSIRPTWLVDIKRQCLVTAKEDCSYIALSYVWGSQLTFKTTKSNLKHLQNEGSLSGPLTTPIPRTIRDAMGIVELLSERYLWVDTLCIVQDDTAQKGREIARMAMIYANASLTIFAAGGEHANSGLPGFHGISVPRQLDQTMYRLDEKTTIVITPVATSPPHLFEPGDNHSVWASRGWIFQEYFFSRRRLIINGGSIRWECKSALWREHVQLPPHLDSTQSGVIPCSFITERSLPSLDLFSKMLTNFNEKQFTYPEDCLHGFAGISLLLSVPLSGALVSGLPTAFFDTCLSWEHRGQLTRRVARDLARATELPSWSWAGWSGNISFSPEPWYDYIKTGPELKKGNIRGTIRTRFWRFHEGPNTIGTQIHASLFDHKDAVKLGHFEYITGWSTHRAPEVANLDLYHPSSICHSHFYKHELYPSYEFWYPLPLMRPGEVVPPVISPYVSTTSQRSWFFCDPEPWMALEGYPLLSLRTHDGCWAGILRPHDGLDISGLTLKEQSEAVELVEIAAGYCHETEWSGVDEIRHKERPKSSPWYEYYTVMWVKWVEGVAYRRGLGRVYKQCWESQRGEPFKLILG